MSLFLALYLFALCGLTAAFVYGIVRPERSPTADAPVQTRRSSAVGRKPAGARRLAA